MLKHKFNQSHFNRVLLPKPLTYYQTIFNHLKIRGKWAQVLCCFHADHHPSLYLNLETGAYKCFACGKNGRDIIDFYQRLHGVDFRAAAKALGAWKN